jgi:hypothetical protein
MVIRAFLPMIIFIIKKMAVKPLHFVQPFGLWGLTTIFLMIFFILWVGSHYSTPIKKTPLNKQGLNEI